MRIRWNLVLHYHNYGMNLVLSLMRVSAEDGGGQHKSSGSDLSVHHALEQPETSVKGWRETYFHGNLNGSGTWRFFFPLFPRNIYGTMLRPMGTTLIKCSYRWDGERSWVKDTGEQIGRLLLSSQLCPISYLPRGKSAHFSVLWLLVCKAEMVMHRSPVLFS